MNKGHSGMDANPEEVADKLVTTRATGFKEMMLNFTDSSGKMLMEELAGSSSLHTGVNRVSKFCSISLSRHTTPQFI